METVETRGLADETELKQEVYKMLDGGSTYRDVAKQTFKVRGVRQHLSISTVSRWVKERKASQASSDEGAIASEVFKMFEAGTSPARVVIQLKLNPDVVAELHAQWEDLSRRFSLSPTSVSQINSRTNYRIKGPLDLEGVISKLVSDHQTRYKFHYACSVCGNTIIAQPDHEWKALVQAGQVAWIHTKCNRDS